jgi:multidrug efflux pump subunit AcrB
MSDDLLHRMRVIRNTAMLLAVLLPVTVYLLSMLWIAPQIGIAFGLVVFIGMVLLAVVVENTILTVERHR